MMPAPAQLDSPPGRPRSTMWTRRPRSARSKAVARPMTPAPTTITSLPASGKKPVLDQGERFLGALDADRHHREPVASADESHAANVQRRVFEPLHDRSERPRLVAQLHEQRVFGDRGE